MFVWLNINYAVLDRRELGVLTKLISFAIGNRINPKN
jgi:hypothetical protein